MKRAIFLDRDGVINKNRPDNVKIWDEFEFEQGSRDALVRLGTTDFQIVVISNQSGIGRGQMTSAAVDAIHSQMIALIAHSGGRIDRIYYCPHRPEDNCTCRKPSPELLLRARDELNLDLAHSYFIGDWIDDVRAARRADATPLLVLSGRGKKALEEMRKAEMSPPHVFENLNAAVNWILQNEAIVQAQVAE
jgi:D-glycero-D-manno-heptose 1,7-bisphosphate phosphatase